MRRDPIVEQVRKARSALMQRYGGDIDALCDVLASRHEPGARYVAFAPKRILETTKAIARNGTRAPLARRVN